jgi:hypothetical protein
MARIVALLIAAACLLALPAAACAEVSDFGSDLSSPANLDIAHGSDTSYWNVALPQGGVVAPAEGQISIVKLKGGVLPNERMRGTPEEGLARIVHFQVLREKGDGTLKVVQLSTGHLDLPVTDDQQQLNRYEPVNLCVKRGDIVAFNTIGAYEYSRPGVNGAQYQVFGRVPNATTQWYEQDNGLNEGATIDPSPFQPYGGYELLMRTTLATGPDATDMCPGGYAQHIFRGLEFKEGIDPSVRTRDRVARVKVFCHGENYGGCFGNLALDATVDGQLMHLGDATFSVKNAYTEVVEVPLSPESVLAIQDEKRLTAVATAESHDDPRSDPRVKWDSVPVQSLTTAEKVVLTPDKQPCRVPKVTGKSSKTAKRKLKAAGCKTGKVKRKRNPAKAGKIVKQSPKAGTVLPAGSAVNLTLATK